MIHDSYGITASLGADHKIRKRIDDSVAFINEHLAQGHSVYGTTI
jgi:histidine ammonia-lyase